MSTAVDTFRPNTSEEVLDAALQLIDEVEAFRHDLEQEPIEVRLTEDFIEMELPYQPTDVELLDAAKKHHAGGYLITFHSGNVPPVYLQPALLKHMCSVDDFALELNGFGHIACELLRFITDKDRAETYGSFEIERLMRSFIGACQSRAVSKSTNQLHAYRWGVTSKVVCSDRVPPNTIEIAPGGRVAARMMKVANIEDEDDLWGTYFLVLRHPFILSYVVQVWPNKHLTKNLVMTNRLDFRKVTHGDADGDGGNYFPLPDEETALAIRQELADEVPEHDGSLLVRGIASHDPEMAMWGENIYEDGKTTQAKFEQSFTKTRKEWLSSHAKMADYANRLTPFSYRISDIGANMAASGWPCARRVSLLGAILEEDFYIGLTGGPLVLDAAMEAWYKGSPKSSKVRATILSGIKSVVPESFLDHETSLALLHAARINQGKIYDPAQDLIPYFTWLMGKGRTSSGKAQECYKPLLQLMEAGIPEHLTDNLLAKMAVFAAQELEPFVGQMTDLTPHDEDDAY